MSSAHGRSARNTLKCVSAPIQSSCEWQRISLGSRSFTKLTAHTSSGYKKEPATMADHVFPQKRSYAELHSEHAQWEYTQLPHSPLVKKTKIERDKSGLALWANSTVLYARVLWPKYQVNYYFHMHGGPGHHVALSPGLKTSPVCGEHSEHTKSCLSIRSP